MACDVDQLIRQIIEFRDKRNWAQFHNPKDLALGLSIEAAELNELFLWKNETEIQKFLATKEGCQRLKEEIADIMIFLLYLSERCGIDLSDAVDEKVEINRTRYPLAKSYDSSNF